MKSKHFQTATELTAWVNLPANAGITIVSITSDTTNGGFTLFYNS